MQQLHQHERASPPKFLVLGSSQKKKKGNVAQSGIPHVTQGISDKPKSDLALFNHSRSSSLTIQCSRPGKARLEIVGYRYRDQEGYHGKGDTAVLFEHELIRFIIFIIPDSIKKETKKHRQPPAEHSHILCSNLCFLPHTVMYGYWKQTLENWSRLLFNHSKRAPTNKIISIEKVCVLVWRCQRMVICPKTSNRLVLPVVSNLSNRIKIFIFLALLPLIFPCSSLQ